MGAAEALRYSSVQLFVQQAAASGIPLAIELAAGRVGVLGLGELAPQLDGRLRLLTGGRLTALPRHRTMRAALDWSYNLLSPPEQTILNRLTIFVGGFTLSAAASVAADETYPGDEVMELVLELATNRSSSPT